MDSVGPPPDDGFDLDIDEDNARPVLSSTSSAPLRVQRPSFFLPPRSQLSGTSMGQDSAEALRDGLEPEASEAVRPVTEYDPFTDKVMFDYRYPRMHFQTFVLATLANYARRPLSSMRIKSMLLAFRLLGVPDVPSYSKYRQSMADVRQRLGSSSKPVRGADGHKFFSNSLAMGLQWPSQDFRNPLIRRQVQLYPRRAAGIKSFQDADRAFEQEKTKSPMVEVATGRHAYVDEVVEHANGHMLVQWWYQGQDGELVGRGLWADRYGHLVLVKEHELCVPVSTITQTALELAGAGGITKVLRGEKEQKLLNPLRRIAQGRMVYSIPLYVFMGDLSGNRSKRWNKHLAYYVQSAAIEAEKPGADATIRLFTVSDKASAQEICEALVEELQELNHQGAICWDSQRQESVIVYAHVGVMIADNPMAAELASNIDLTGFDVRRDLPCEVLHTILLGTVKYLARQTLKDMTADQTSLLVQWLKEVDMNGIGDEAKIMGAYMAKHVQSLVRKDLKRLCQVMHWSLIHTDVDESVASAWQAQGELAAALFCPELRRSESETWKASHTRRQPMSLAKAGARRCILPEAPIKKPKLHVLSHAVEAIQRFGPLPLVSSERFESFNTIIREASILSNRKNASRDIARRVADEDMMCDIIAGATFMDHTSNTPRQIGPGIRNMLATDDLARNFFHKAYGLTRLAAEAGAEEVNLSARTSEMVKLGNGDWAKAGDRSSTRVGIVQTVLRINEAEAGGPLQTDAKLTIRPLWQRDGWDGWAYGPSATPLEEETCPDVGPKDIITVLNTNHNCRSMQCRPSADGILHLGDNAERVVNSSCFRSTLAVTITLQRMRVETLTAQELGEALLAAKIASS
ncbi:hypothetical protein V8E36_005793 [Tilletia maclaganii]